MSDSRKRKLDLSEFTIPVLSTKIIADLLNKYCDGQFSAAIKKDTDGQEIVQLKSGTPCALTDLGFGFVYGERNEFETFFRDHESEELYKISRVNREVYSQAGGTYLVLNVRFQYLFLTWVLGLAEKPELLKQITVKHFSEEKEFKQVAEFMTKTKQYYAEPLNHFFPAPLVRMCVGYLGDDIPVKLIQDDQLDCRMDTDEEGVEFERSVRARVG